MQERSHQVRLTIADCISAPLLFSFLFFPLPTPLEFLHSFRLFSRSSLFLIQLVEVTAFVDFGSPPRFPGTGHRIAVGSVVFCTVPVAPLSRKSGQTLHASNRVDVDTTSIDERENILFLLWLKRYLVYSLFYSCGGGSGYLSQLS